MLELSRRILPPPEIMHVHDWQTALVPVLTKDRRLPFKTVLTIHNLAFQGSFWAYDFGLTRLPGHYFGPQGVEYYGRVNLLKGGILAADAITTVSERYAREIQTPEYGFGLDPVVREHAHKLTGILNGADYDRLEPGARRAAAGEVHARRSLRQSAPAARRSCASSASPPSPKARSSPWSRASPRKRESTSCCR